MAMVWVSKLVVLMLNGEWEGHSGMAMASARRRRYRWVDWWSQEGHGLNFQVGIGPEEWGAGSAFGLSYGYGPEA